MKVQRLFQFTLLFAIMLVMAIASPALAEKGKKHTLEDSLQGIKWGDSRLEVYKKISARMNEDLNNDKSLKRDNIKKQRALKDLMDKKRKFEESRVQFKSERTGYEVSVVANEFTPNNNESMLMMRDEHAQRYYMFIDGKFYKLVVAYNKNYLQGVTFENFVGQTMKRYGRPKDIEYGEILGDEELMKASWSSRKTDLMLNNQREMFNTYSMVFSDCQRSKSLLASGRKFGGKGKRGKKVEKVSSEVSSLMTGGVNTSNDSVVDGMVGDIKIDLSEGRPEDEKLREQEEAELAAKETSSKKKAKKKTKKRRKKVKKKKKKNLGDFDSGDKELVIY